MNCLVIYNPNSGKEKQAKNIEYISSRLHEKYEVVDVCATQHARHATEIASQACEKYDLIVAMGGDGTLSEVINGLAGKKKKCHLGYIPRGTVNDVAHSLKIPCNVKKGVDVILNGKVVSHDLFKANDKYGIYVCCAGLFTETSYSTKQSAKKKVGKIAYVFHGVKKVFSTDSMDLKLSFDGGEISGRFAFMLILNSRSVGGFPINRSATLDDGMVDIVLIREKHKKIGCMGIYKVFSLFLKGVRYQGIRLKLDKFTVEAANDVDINIDGEKVFAGSFDFEVLPNDIYIIVP